MGEKFLFVLVKAPGNLCTEIGQENIKIIFKNMLPYPVELYEMKNTGVPERLQKDFDKEDYLTLVTPQSKKWLFKRQNDSQSLNICVSGKTDILFKRSHFGFNCEKPVVVRIFLEGMQ